MSTFVLPPLIKLHFPSMSTYTIRKDYKEETSILSSGEIMDTNGSLSSWTSTGALTSTEITSTAYADTNVHQPPSTSATTYVSADDIVTGSHTFTFNCYSQRAGYEVGRYLVSDTFTAGGHDWAINLYPNGRRYEYKDYISLYITLESEETDVNAVFELMLVDQSGKGKHRIQTHFGKLQEKQPFLMRRRGSQWGSGRYLKNVILKESDYLKDDCLVVNCVVGVLAARGEKEISDPTVITWNHLSSSINDEGMNESNCEDTKIPHLRSAEKLINYVDGRSTFGFPMQLQELIYGGWRAFSEYLYAVDEFQKSTKSRMFSSYETQGRAMKTLQLVFKGILTFSISGTKSDIRSSTVYSSSVTSSSSYELQGSSHTAQGELSSEQVYRLRNIAERLISTGCLGDCIEAYKISRKSAVDARFLRFGIGKWSIEDLQGLDCEEFAANIRLWIQTAKKCYYGIFPGERQYYEKIFGGVCTVTYDNCFLTIVEQVAIELNNFADAVSSISSFQKLFAVLDLYKALSDLIPEIRNMFPTILSANISQVAIKTIQNLATLVRRLFSSFEYAVLNERLNPLNRDGSIHSLTVYAMNYVTSISQYKEPLINIILSRPIESLGYQLDEQLLGDSGKSPLQLHMIWIMICLRINLEGKSRCHEHLSLRYVFMMNNVNYIIKTITGSPELLELIGKEYVSNLSKYVMQATQDYFSSIWPRLSYCLRDARLNNKFTFYDKISKDSLKDRFKAFNTTFEEVCQTTSFVLDIQLRDDLHRLILKSLLPAYKSFTEKYGSHTLSKRYKEKYIKYSSKDLDIAFRTLTIHNSVAIDSGIN